MQTEYTYAFKNLFHGEVIKYFSDEPKTIHSKCNLFFPSLPVHEVQMQRFILPQLRRSGVFADGTGCWWLPQQSRGLLHPTGDDAAAAPCMASKGIPKATEMLED